MQRRLLRRIAERDNQLFLIDRVYGPAYNTIVELTRQGGTEFEPGEFGYREEFVQALTSYAFQMIDSNIASRLLELRESVSAYTNLYHGLRDKLQSAIVEASSAFLETFAVYRLYLHGPSERYQLVPLVVDRPLQLLSQARDPQDTGIIELEVVYTSQKSSRVVLGSEELQRWTGLVWNNPTFSDHFGKMNSLRNSIRGQVSKLEPLLKNEIRRARPSPRNQGIP